MELSLENVTKSFKDRTAVCGLNFTFRSGIYGLLGANGAGKTTLMRMLCTLLKPTEGRILCDGTDIWELDGRYRAMLGYLPQEFGCYPDFNARDYLMYIASVKGLRHSAAAGRTEELLRRVGLEREARHKVRTFSGGMKRRLGIAQAMLNDPKILILDEPTAGLDPSERIRFRNLISDLSQDRTVLLSTHIVSDIEYIAHHILFMKQGRIEHDGTPEQLLETSPAKVWRFTAPAGEAAGYSRACRIVNRRTLGSLTELRALSDSCPAPGAERETPTLEDLFLYYFGETEEAEHDTL